MLVTSERYKPDRTESVLEFRNSKFSFVLNLIIFNFYKLFLQLKLERQHQSNSVLIPQTEQEIADLDLQIQNLSQIIKVDEEIYQNLLKQIAKKMTSEEK